MTGINFTSPPLDLSAMEKIAANLAIELEKGDLIALVGPLGAGKSAFARHCIRSLFGDDSLEVPSPTFTLVQPYERDGAADIYHCDLYRLSEEDEIEALALDEVGGTSILIVEWPEKLPVSWRENALTITFSILDEIDVDGENLRALTFSGHQMWTKRIHLEALIHD